MLYPENEKKSLENKLFEDPGCEYRGAPFWAWNGKLDDARLGREIEIMKKMGFGGYHMHVRTGMDSPYLDADFMGHVDYCNKKGKAEGMLSWLYDEDRWPSGTAGGKVTGEHPEFAKRTLLFTTEPYTPERPHAANGSEPGRGQRTVRQDNGELIAIYDVCLNSDGTLASARITDGKSAPEGRLWYAYVEKATDDPWFNDHPYVDTLSKEAINEFIAQTHEKYYAAFSSEFGHSMPAIFTDEPQFTPKQSLSFAAEERDVFFPWTDGIIAAYRERFGEELTEVLPELVWERADGKLSAARWRFHNLVCDMFVEAFCKNIGAWCINHGIELTGHVNGEATLMSQTQAVGDAMRCYPYFGIPGIDMLCDFHEYNTAKQCQSIVRQAGKQAMMSELYGVTGWDYDFRGYKLQGDWQAALGVSVRVPHLTWMTMKGEAKRDYPACIGYQSPWWEEYSMVENHFACLNTALTRGKAKVNVAVIHPIESYWTAWGPAEQTHAVRSRMDEQFAALTEMLLFGLVDFDFICESYLPEQCAQGTNPLKVGKMEYDTVIVCGSVTLRRTTVERLTAFAKAGGKVVFVGDCPRFVDAVEDDSVKELYDASTRVSFSASAILGEIEKDRFVDIRDDLGVRPDHLIYQARNDGNDTWLFIANGKNPVCPDVEGYPKYRIIINGEYACTEYDTLTGEIKPVNAVYSGGKTMIERVWCMHDSLLLKLVPGRAEACAPRSESKQVSADVIKRTVNVSLDEDNMLLLDMAETSLDGGEFMPMEEILRADNIARRKLGIPLRRKEIVQPYLIKPEKCEHTITLRFTINSEIEHDGACLALEDAAETKIKFNGEDVPSEVIGWWVDEDIEKIRLPHIHKGLNVLETTAPIGRRTNLECMYMLGNFGVRVNGVEKTLIAPVSKLGFGDIVPQGLPFYTGNVNYMFDVVTDGSFSVRVPQYRGGLVKVFVDGAERGNIAFSPYRLDIGGLEPGQHSVMLKLYGVRYNGFAQLHHTQGIYFYQSPNSWRSEGDLWHYEYTFKPMGILKSPEIIAESEPDDRIIITERS